MWISGYFSGKFLQLSSEIPATLSLQVTPRAWDWCTMVAFNMLIISKHLHVYWRNSTGVVLNSLEDASVLPRHQTLTDVLTTVALVWHWIYMYIHIYFPSSSQYLGLPISYISLLALLSVKQESRQYQCFLLFLMDDRSVKFKSKQNTRIKPNNNIMFFHCAKLVYIKKHQWGST